MFLRSKDGFYAGQVREFPPHVGQELLREGRAENPFAEFAAEIAVATERPKDDAEKVSGRAGRGRNR